MHGHQTVTRSNSICDMYSTLSHRPHPWTYIAGRHYKFQDQNFVHSPETYLTELGFEPQLMHDSNCRETVDRLPYSDSFFSGGLVV